MKLFVDCEFNGFGGDLLSMAIVSEDGREFYEVIYHPYTVDPWVEEHVVPVFGKEPVIEPMFRHLLHVFLTGFDNPIVIADWYTDLMHFFASLSGEDHASSLDWACRAELVPSLTITSETPHNALSDARAIMKAYLS